MINNNKIIQEQLIDFNTAVLAKEKGFNIPLSTWYDEKGILIDENSDYHMSYMYDNGGLPYSINTLNIFIAPTQSVLQKWLREIHNCIIEITFYGYNITSVKDIKYEIEIDYYGKDFNLTGDSSDYSSSDYDTYEEALEVGLFQALLLL